MGALLEHLLSQSFVQGLYAFGLAHLMLALWLGRRGDLVWPRPDRAVVRSLCENFALLALNGFFAGVVFAGFYAASSTAWSSLLGWEAVAIGEGLPFWAAVLVAVVAFDFTNYWNHRMLHTRPGWGVHFLHHSDRQMTFATSYRVHVFEHLFMTAWAALVLGWMSLPVAAVGLAGLIGSWYSKYVHCGLPFEHGPLRRVFVSPNYHRWHHCEDPQVYGKNLADMFALWDVWFGTHHDPGTCDVSTGVADAPDDILRAQVFPFVYWWRMLRGAGPETALKTAPEAAALPDAP